MSGDLTAAGVLANFPFSNFLMIKGESRINPEIERKERENIWPQKLG